MLSAGDIFAGIPESGTLLRYAGDTSKKEAHMFIKKMPNSGHDRDKFACGVRSVIKNHYFPDEKAFDNISDVRKNEMPDASLSMIRQLLQDRDLAFVSAYRPEFSKRQNEERSEELKNTIRNLGMGYIQLEGRWEDPRTHDIDSEESLLVSYCMIAVGVDTNDFEKCIIRLGQIYDQDAVIVKKGGQEGVIYRRDGSTEPLGDWHPNKISMVYSKIKGRPFIFEKQTDFFSNFPMGMLGGMGWKYRRKDVLRELGIQFDGDLMGTL